MSEEFAEDEKTDSFTLNLPASEGGPRATLADELDHHKKRLAKLHGHETIGLVQKTIPELDKATKGLRGLTILAARPGIGKTALALQIGLDVVRADPKAVLVYVTLDHSRWELYDRALSRWSRVEYDKLRLEKADVAEAENILREIGSRVRIVDGAAADLDVACVEQNVRAFEGDAHPLIVIDSLDGWAPAGHGEDARLDALLALKRVASERGAVLATAETRRSLTAAKAGDDDPLVGFLGSARRAAIADQVLALEIEGATPGVGPQSSDDGTRAMYLGIVKGRDGATPATIALTHHHRESRFEPR